MSPIFFLIVNFLNRLMGDVLVDSRLDEFYMDIVKTVEGDEDIIAQVFPSPPAVLSQLIQRIFEQRVCSASCFSLSHYWWGFRVTHRTGSYVCGTDAQHRQRGRPSTLFAYSVHGFGKN